MVSAPTSESEWLTFVGLCVILYVSLVFFLTDTGILQALVSGTFFGLIMAISVALLVVLWRGIPDLLYPESEESTHQK